jgi:hypothetical protein
MQISILTIGGVSGGRTENIKDVSFIIPTLKTIPENRRGFKLSVLYCLCQVNVGVLKIFRERQKA